jgi:glycosyltransferase
LKISIITVTLNAANTIGDCLDSVAWQIYENREHIVIDGVSRDSTLGILRARRSQIAVLVSEPDQGIYDALNKGIAYAKGDVVGFLHADDLYASPHVLTDIASAFSDPEVCAVYGDLQCVRKEDTSYVVRHWRSSVFTSRRLAWGWMPPHPTFYVRLKWYDRIGGFDTRYQIAADYLSILQMFGQSDFKAVYLPKVLIKMRLGGVSNRSLRSILSKSREDWDALRSTGIGALGGFGALAWKNLGKVRQFF